GAWRRSRGCLSARRTVAFSGTSRALRPWPWRTRPLPERSFMVMSATSSAATSLTRSPACSMTGLQHELYQRVIAGGAHGPDIARGVHVQGTGSARPPAQAAQGVQPAIGRGGPAAGGDHVLAVGDQLVFGAPFDG